MPGYVARQVERFDEDIPFGERFIFPPVIFYPNSLTLCLCFSLFVQDRDADGCNVHIVGDVDGDTASLPGDLINDRPMEPV